MFFVWDDGNEEHIGEHGVSRYEAQEVVRRAAMPYPRRIEQGKYLVRGQTKTGRYLQVIYAVANPARIDLDRLEPADAMALEAGEKGIYVLHARELTSAERQQVRRSRKS